MFYSDLFGPCYFCSKWGHPCELSVVIPGSSICCSHFFNTRWKFSITHTHTEIVNVLNCCNCFFIFTLWGFSMTHRLCFCTCQCTTATPGICFAFWLALNSFQCWNIVGPDGVVYHAPLGKWHHGAEAAQHGPLVKTPPVPCCLWTVKIHGQHFLFNLDMRCVMMPATALLSFSNSESPAPRLWRCS